jgi:hypothetical protein
MVICQCTCLTLLVPLFLNTNDYSSSNEAVKHLVAKDLHVIDQVTADQQLVKLTKR